MGGGQNAVATLSPLPHAPPLSTRHDAPSRAVAKKRATTTPFLRAKVEGTGSRGDGGPSAPAPPSTEFEDRKKKERTNEGPRKRPRKQRGAFDFRRRGVSIYFSQLSLFRPPATTFRNSAYFEPFWRENVQYLIPKGPQSQSQKAST